MCMDISIVENAVSYHFLATRKTPLSQNVLKNDFFFTVGTLLRELLQRKWIQFTDITKYISLFSHSVYLF